MAQKKPQKQAPKKTQAKPQKKQAQQQPKQPPPDLYLHEAQQPPAGFSLKAGQARKMIDDYWNAYQVSDEDRDATEGILPVIWKAIAHLPDEVAILDLYARHVWRETRKAPVKD